MARRTTYVDPIFYLPVEVEDFKPLDVENVEESEIDGSEQGFDSSTPGIAAVDSIEIVAQEFRTLADGSHVVDLIIEVEDIDAVETYNIRVTKA